MKTLPSVFIGSFANYLSTAENGIFDKSNMDYSIGEMRAAEYI